MTDQNPYDSRDHESTGPRDRGDVMAVAALLGSVSGQLKDIDSKNIGDSSFTKAFKIDAKQKLQEFAGVVGSDTPPEPTLAPQQVVQPVPQNVPELIPVPQNKSAPSVPNDLEKRIVALEKAIDNDNNKLKFKRGVTYNINTVNVKGDFREPQDIVNVLLNEMSKGVKTITLKLNDTTKNKQ